MSHRLPLRVEYPGAPIIGVTDGANQRGEDQTCFVEAFIFAYSVS